MTRQPTWKLLANLGDVSPVDYGGYFVYEDTTGVYDPEVELLVSPDNDEGEWTVYRFGIPRCTLIDGVMSDNEFHPELKAWFADDLAQVAQCFGMTLEELQRNFISDSLVERARAYQAVGIYHGFENFNSYPLTFNCRAEVEARYASEVANS